MPTTHHYITTGIEENKFGSTFTTSTTPSRPAGKWNTSLIGLHFHIGSQITDLTVFRGLCLRVNEIQSRLKEQGIILLT